MEKKMRMLIIIITLLIALLLVSCSKQATSASPVTGASVQDLKQTACEAADQAGTCSTRLPELGFITKEDCCELFKKCC
jgi:PBP1b-binding outer membrane lipoprotein LpoB